MNSRERIRAALNHQPTDLLPIDFGGMRSTGIQAIAYAKLVEYLGFDEKTYVYDVFQQLARPSEAVIDRFGGDVLQVSKRRPAFGISIESYKDGVLPNGQPCCFPQGFNPVTNAQGDLDILSGETVIARMPKGGLYFDLVNRPYEKAQSVADIDALPTTGLEDADIDFMAATAKNLFETTDKALLMEFGGNIFEAGQSDFGYESLYVNIAIEKDLMHYYFNRITDRYIADLKKLMPKVAPYINVIQFGDDLGTQIAPQISKDMYVEMIKPYHKRLYSFIREEYPDVKVFLHSCGAIFDLIPELIDAGVQVLNPVQISAKGMEPQRLKDAYGKDLVFWGAGANMQEVVPENGTEEIKRQSTELIEIFSKGGGYVFNQVHNIQADVPPEKVAAIYDAALAWRNHHSF